MAAYGSNYQFAQSPSGAPPPQQQQYGGQPQYGQQQQAQQQQYGMFSPQGSVNQFNPHGSMATAPARTAPRRSLSMGSAQAMKSVASFDPYASTTSAAPPTGGQTPTGYYTQQAPPSFPMEEMTTSPHTNFGFAQPPPQQQAYDPTASTVSDISMFSNSPFSPAASATATENALVPAGAPAPGGEGDFSEGSVDPAVLAEQERIWQDIQDRRKMQRIRADNRAPHQRSMVPYNNGSSRQTPARTRSMPHPNASKSQDQSLARGGVAVLDPKKDLRKQTRKMKTASGAVGGAVVGGLILGPVGVVLGASGGAAAANKMAKSRDKRKQAQFEQKNFQRGAAQSVAAKGEGSFV